MDKKLDSVFKEMYEKILSLKVELIKKYASLSVPGFITFDGKDIENDFLNQEDLSSFIQDNYSKFAINIEQFYKHIEDIQSNNNSEDAMRECLEKTEALYHNSEQTTQLLLCICSAVRKIIFSINELLPSKPDDSDKETIELIKCALERMLGANEYYEGCINDSINTLFQKDLEKELEKYQDKKALLSVCYRQMYASSMSLLSQMSFDSMIVMFLYQKVDKYFNGPKENKSSIEADLKQIIRVNEMIFANTQQTNTKLDTVGKTTEKLVKGQDETQRKIIVQGDKLDRKLEKIEDKVNKRNRADKRKPLTQEECATILYKQKINFFKKKESYLRFVGMTATKPTLPKDEKSVERTIQRWDQYFSSDGKKGTPPPKGYSRERSRKEFEAWAEALEQIAYENWKKDQPIIRRKNKTDGLVETDSPEKEDEENLEEEEDNLETRGQVDLVQRVTRSTKID